MCISNDVREKFYIWSVEEVVRFSRLQRLKGILISYHNLARNGPQTVFDCFCFILFTWKIDSSYNYSLCINIEYKILCIDDQITSRLHKTFKLNFIQISISTSHIFNQICNVAVCNHSQTCSHFTFQHNHSKAIDPCGSPTWLT